LSGGGEPIRVLHVLMRDTVGGTERVVASIAERLQTEDITTDVAIFGRAGPIAERLEKANVRVSSLGRPLTGGILRLARRLRASRYDIVNAYGLKASVISRALVRLLASDTVFIVGVRGLVVTETEDEAGVKARLATRIERLGSRWVDRYDVNSRGAIELLTRSGINGDRMTYIPNGVDLERWPARAATPRTESPPLVVCVARFVPRKRQQDLVVAAAKLREKGITCRVCFAGDGPTLGDVRALSNRLGGEGAVDFLGSLDETRVRELLNRADIACLPSQSEGMAGTVLEAMATGLPVLGTDVNGIRELVTDGETGVLVPPGRPDLLAEALSRLLADPELRVQLGERGRQRAETEFSFDRMIDAKARLYRSVSQA
jgi:L-malate glycosyltransferase